MRRHRLPFTPAYALAALFSLYATPGFAQNIQVSPSSLSATVAKGQSTTLTLNLQKSGTEQHFWEPKTNVTWVTLSPVYGSNNTITAEVDQGSGHHQ
jgi:hypothetical protein